jgi:DNA invertase Pin-like site-specific DNA recombinase
MDAVIYTRVSTDEQAVSGTSLNSQESECRAWCQRNAYTVVKLFTDAGESAKSADRPQFLAMIAWCRVRYGSRPRPS